ncbi:AMP-binding protein [Alphaproteobacteria bacterium]|nr:AMP-binding protein [Alphaproteobacteria bacterium]
MTNSLYSNLIEPNLNNNNTFLILDDRTEISYKDFISLSSKISHKLTNLGLKSGDHILVKSPKCKETLSLYLSSILTGSVFFPLNSNYTLSETIYFIEDSKPSFLICESSEVESIKPICDNIGCKILSLNANGEGEVTNNLDSLDSFFKPNTRVNDDLAALLYTSGTTGKPKGAMLTHQNLVSNAHQLTNLWNIDMSDTLIHSLPIYHTHGLFVAVNTSMMSGASIRFIKNFNIDLVIDAFKYSTLMMGVPTFYTRLIKDKRLDKSLTKNMKLFISGSAPLLNETHQDFYNITGHRILERYGMTETNMNTSNPFDGERKAGSVGKPLKGINIRINKTKGYKNTVHNEIGMIEIMGPNVFKGYLNNPKKTQEAFTEDGYFITGDIGHFDKDGYLFIVGRNKDLIISGGFNVYPKEIEDVINKHKSVIESAVFGIKDNDLGEVPIAAVVMINDNKEIKDLSVFVENNLVKYKIPKKYIVINELPKNVMGKVQKNILKDKYS